MQIKDLSIFHNLDDAEFKKSLVCTQSVIHEYKKNDYIFFQGDVPNKLYLILNGEVELGSINVNGKVLRITNISEGEDFGEVELFLNKDRYSGYAKAKTDVKLLEIAKDFFGGRCEKNCSHHSKVVFNMLELFAKRTDENNQQLEVITSGNIKHRIASYLLEHADNNNLVSLSMNREELALYLNTTRPSLSRTLLSLQEDGFIHLSSRKSIKILDAEALLYIEYTSLLIRLVLQKHLYPIHRLDIPNHLEYLQMVFQVQFLHLDLLPLDRTHNHMVHIHISS